MKKEKIWLIGAVMLFALSGCTTNQDTDEVAESQWLIEPGIYKDIRLIGDDLLAVKDSVGQYRLVDGNERMILEETYLYILDGGEHMVRLMDTDKKLMFTDEEGNLLSEEKFQEAYCFCEGMAAVKKNDQWGFINAQGELVIDYRYDDVSEGFREGVAAVEKDGAFYFINQCGERAFEQEFESASEFSEGLAAVQSDGKWGYIDHSGEFVIDCQYDGAGDFSEEKAAVMKETDGVCKWAYITPKNEIVIDYQLYGTSEGRMQTVGEFHQGYALVTDELYCLINEQGETVLGSDTCFLTAGGIYDLDTGYLAAYEYTDEAMTEKKYGVINVNGEIIVPFVYENIAEIKGGLAVVTCRQENELKTGVLKVDDISMHDENN